MPISYKTELDPSNAQRGLFVQHAGLARWAYNWGLRRIQEAYAAAEKMPSAYDLEKELVQLKKRPAEDGGVPWMVGLSCGPSKRGLANLQSAFVNFFRRCREGAKKKGYPRFKSRKRGLGSFTFNDPSDVTECSIRLPRIGVVKLKEKGYIPEGRYSMAIVSERAGRWFVAVRQKTTPARDLGTEVLGVDMGVKVLAVLSDGTRIENPKALRSAEKRLRMLQKRVSRREKGSANRKKAAADVAKIHYRIACVRNDAAHKATTAIAARAKTVVVEDLNIKGMAKNRKLAKSVADAGMGEFLRQLKYKMEWSGGEVIEADRWYPSSKTCSECGHVLGELSLSVRRWVCPKCAAEHDRDENAARNLRNLAQPTAAE